MVATQRNSDIFDAHLHFFYLEEGDYNWLKSGLPKWPNLSLIQKNFTPNDLVLGTSFKLVNYTHIESGFDNLNAEHEVDFLEDKNGFEHCAIASVKIDQEPDKFKSHINQLLAYTTFVGVRDITEGTEAVRLLDQNVKLNLEYLAQHSLIFEAQFEVSQINITQHLCQLANDLPHLSIVVNHAGLVDLGSINKWQIGLLDIAKCSNISIKYSGFEMLGLTLDNSFRQAVFNTLIQVVGDKRIMFASNFPVCLMASSYESLWHSYYSYCKSHDQWQRLSSSNAVSLYQK